LGAFFVTVVSERECAMILHVISDLHLDSKTEEYKQEFFSKLKQKAEQDNPDLLVIAGDFFDSYAETYEDQFNLLLSKFEAIYKKVLFIGGNHDYWDSTINERDEFFLKKNSEKTKWLNPATKFELDGKTFAGGTMWFPRTKNWFNEKRWCDYYYIKGEIRPHDEHQSFLEWVPQADIFVTHHYPTEESIHPQFKNYQNNMFFHAQMDSTLEKWAAEGKLPKLWIHGHTHAGMDYVSKWGFRVYCNPLGHEFEDLNLDFWSRLKVEIK
jgi:predicted MPP superfamily phosphohydrolase